MTRWTLLVSFIAIFAVVALDDAPGAKGFTIGFAVSVAYSLGRHDVWREVREALR